MTETAKHTPGPWLASPEDNGYEWGVDAGEWGICICADSPGDGSAKANANLIAAAPDLLAALKQIMLDIPDVVRREGLLYIYVALSKARGEL